MNTENVKAELIDSLGKVIKSSQILQGSTLSIIETDTLYNGIYFLKLSDSKNSNTYKIVINK